MISDTDSDLHVGSHFGHYVLEKQLSQDAVADLYQADDTRNNRTVALKIFTPYICTDLDLREQLLTYARHYCTVDAVHCVKLTDYGDIDQRVYFELTFIPSVSLSKILTAQTYFSPPRAVALIWQIARALEVNYVAGVQYHDIQPANILLTDNDAAYLTSFNSISLCRELFTDEIPVDFLNTPQRCWDYLSPEQCQDQHIQGPASDVYALTLVFIELLTGTPVFHTSDLATGLQQRFTVSPSWNNHEQNGRFLKEIDSVISRGLARKPTNRYENAIQFAQAVFQKLTLAEQHQVIRILRRVGSTYPQISSPEVSSSNQIVTISSGTSDSPEEKSIELSTEDSSISHNNDDHSHSTETSSLSSLNQQEDFHTLPSNDIPPDSQHDVSLSGIKILRNPDFGYYPLPMPKEGNQTHRSRVLALVAALCLVVGISIGIYAFFTEDAHAVTVAMPPEKIVPITELDYRLSPGNLVIDNDGTIYVTTLGMRGKITVLSPHHSPSILVHSDSYQPNGIAMDSQHNIYFTDTNNRVIKITHDKHTVTTLGISGLDNPNGIAVDPPGNIVYVVDHNNNQVIKFDTTTTTQTILPFTGLMDPVGIALDQAGNLYLTDTGNDRVLKLAHGSNEQVVLPFNGIHSPQGIAVDDTGTVYVTERVGNKAMKLPANGAVPIVLPFTGLNSPMGITVDQHHHIYLADRGNDRIVELVK